LLLDVDVVINLHHPVAGTSMWKTNFPWKMTYKWWVFHIYVRLQEANKWTDTCYFLELGTIVL
jgi:hypothetical protein